LAKYDLCCDDDRAVFLDVIVQALRTLAFVHARGLVHGDLKPQNVLVTDEVKPRAKLIDFGITAGEHQYSSKRVLGTKSYIAPEAIVGSHLDRRTDLYSFGAVFYHLVVGEPPFGNSSNLRILKDHVERAPKPPSHRRLGLPTAFDDVILRLLAKKPADRFQDALEVVQAINEAFGRNDPLETEESIAGYLDSAPMRDRAEELQVAHRAFCLSCRVAGDDQEALTSQWANEDDGFLAGDNRPKPCANTLLVRGENGSGRQRMLNHLKAITQPLGVAVIQVRRGAKDFAGGGESGGFVRLLQALCSCFDESVLGDVVERALGLGERSPRVLSPADQELLQELAGRLLAVTTKHAVVLMVDSPGEADALTQAFFAALVRGLKDGVSPRSRLFLVVALSLRLCDHESSLLDLLDCEGARPDAVEVNLCRLDREGAQ
jgi:hypothetical protein